MEVPRPNGFLIDLDAITDGEAGRPVDATFARTLDVGIIRGQRYYRLELPAPAMPASARLASKCKTQGGKLSEGSVLVKAVGDSYPVTPSSYENKSSKTE